MSSIKKVEITLLLQVFPIGSPLVTDVSRAILNVTEGQKMVEIEKKWFGDKDICPDSNTIISPKNLGLASFWGLFMIVGIISLIVLIIYVIRFLRDNWSVVEQSDPESTAWTKVLELLQKFDNKDFRSHTFKNPRMLSERDDVFYGECISPNVQQSPSNFSMALSPRTNGPPSPVFSSPSTIHNASCHGVQMNSIMENATASPRGE